MLKDRAPRAVALLDENGLDACCFVHRPNLRYLCGFTGSDGALVVSRAASCFLTDSRYTTQAQAEVAGSEVRTYQIKHEGLGAYLTEIGARRVGYEAEQLSCAGLRRLQQVTASIEWVPLESQISSLRGIKDRAEITAMSEAAALAAESFAEIRPLLSPGSCERDIALAFEYAMKRRGAEEKAFDFIVASGERGAMPHGVASTRKLRNGELVTLDFGLRWQGYHCDETVTVAIGPVSDVLRRLHDVVLQAHDLAITALRPGLALRELDAIARRHIESAGYGAYFGHGLGHGIGLEVHEYPTVSPRSDAIAEAGMVFTIEPGIYIPELGGVRIEDMLEVTADGCRKLTRIDKEFTILAA